MKITPQTILAISPHANPKLIVALAAALNKWLPIYGMQNKEIVRQALGQWAEETDGFRVLHEYASGKAYEGRKDLGNIQIGDGVKFAGAGIDMLTGRANFTREGQELGLDLVNHPELLLIADYAVESGCQFWKDNGLIALAINPANFHAITVKINGGTNGIAVRWAYYQAACQAITEDVDATGPLPAPSLPTTPIPAPVALTPPKPQPPLQRVPSVLAKPPFSLWRWLASFFTTKPAPMGLLGVTNMSLLPSTNSLNISSIILAIGGLGAVLPKIITEFGTVGIIAAGAMAVGVLVQAFIPPATAIAIENTLADTVIPAVVAFDPALKASLDQVAVGLHAAAAASTANTAATANNTVAVTAAATPAAA